ncbi:hypothetical protein CBR_g8250 [Chara braunii]|uniref:PP4R3 EVH1-like domain-containing protein n=1 Tax=Chara braunii TaxID=69332 RepID=A0A388KLM7_CHABU|nr:hypothetical protein CBR_g8250 [Chara braunii]|eukprot:GBG70950.1 hypothetical protein CBR_g8250 [Chara braunii]
MERVKMKLRNMCQGSIADAEGRWRVKVCQLNEQGKWDDRGTGHVSVDYIEQAEAVGLVVIDEKDNSHLLLHRISPEDIYHRQEDTIISWTDQDASTDLALSFQEAIGCACIWDQMSSAQRQIQFPPVGDDILHDGVAGDVPDLANLPQSAKNTRQLFNAKWCQTPNTQAYNTCKCGWLDWVAGCSDWVGGCSDWVVACSDWDNGFRQNGATNVSCLITMMLCFLFLHNISRVFFVMARGASSSSASTFLSEDVYRNYDYSSHYPGQPKRPSDDELLEVCGERLGDESGVRWSFDEMLQLLYMKQQEVNALKMLLDRQEEEHLEALEGMLNGIRLGPCEGAGGRKRAKQEEKGADRKRGADMAVENVELGTHVDENLKLVDENLKLRSIYNVRCHTLGSLRDMVVNLHSNRDGSLLQNMIRWRERAVSLDIQVRKLLTISDTRRDICVLASALFKHPTESTMREIEKRDALSAVRCLEWLAETFLQRAIMAEVQTALNFPLTKHQEEGTMECLFNLLLRSMRSRQRLAYMISAEQSVTEDYKLTRQQAADLVRMKSVLGQSLLLSAQGRHATEGEKKEIGSLIVELLLLQKSHAKLQKEYAYLLVLRCLERRAHCPKCGCTLDEIRPHDAEARKTRCEKIRERILEVNNAQGRSVQGARPSYLLESSLESKFRGRKVRNALGEYRKSIVETGARLRSIDTERTEFVDDMHAEVVIGGDVVVDRQPGEGPLLYDAMARVRQEDDMPGLIPVWYNGEDERLDDD